MLNEFILAYNNPYHTNGIVNKICSGPHAYKYQPLTLKRKLEIIEGDLQHAVLLIIRNYDCKGSL